MKFLVIVAIPILVILVLILNPKRRTDSIKASIYNDDEDEKHPFGIGRKRPSQKQTMWGQEQKEPANFYEKYGILTAQFLDNSIDLGTYNDQYFPFKDCYTPMNFKEKENTKYYILKPRYKDIPRNRIYLELKKDN